MLFSVATLVSPFPVFLQTLVFFCSSVCAPPYKSILGRTREAGTMLAYVWWREGQSV